MIDYYQSVQRERLLKLNTISSPGNFGIFSVDFFVQTAKMDREF